MNCNLAIGYCVCQTRLNHRIKPILQNLKLLPHISKLRNLKTTDATFQIFNTSHQMQYKLVTDYENTKPIRALPHQQLTSNASCWLASRRRVEDRRWQTRPPPSSSVELIQQHPGVEFRHNSTSTLHKIQGEKCNLIFTCNVSYAASILCFTISYLASAIIDSADTPSA